MADTNGNGNAGYARLRKVLAELEEKAAAVRMTLSLLEGHDTTTKVERTGGGILAQALAIDSARRGPGRPRGTAAAPSRATLKKQSGRERVHALLSKYAPGDRIPSNEAPLVGALVTYGYLRRDGDDYIRTDKPHYLREYDAKRTKRIADPVVSQPSELEAAVERQPQTKALLRKRREVTAAFLAAYKPKEIIDPSRAVRYKGIGMLARYGYIRKTAKGWQRTAKPYDVGARDHA